MRQLVGWLFATTVLALALTQVGEAEQARALAVDTLDRCQNALGPDHLITLLAGDCPDNGVTDLADTPS